MYSVTSSFISLAASKQAAWSRQLMIGGSDYSSKVLKWPSISRSWDTASPKSVTIDLSNADRTFNFFLTDGTKLHTSCSINMGFDVSSEAVNVMAGTIDSLKFNNEKCSITIIDKFKVLTDRLVGDSSTPTNYISSSYLVHDMAWYLCTSYGGLSALTSTNNPDIDYSSFNSWTSVFSTDNVRIRGSFSGQTAAELLKKIANLTQSAIWVENNKLKFSRFTIATSAALSFDESTIIDGTQAMDERDLVNKHYVNANYDVTSKVYAIVVNDNSSSSISRYGLKEKTSNETNVWYTDSASALNFAQRMVLTGKEILPKMTIKTPLQSVHITIGDCVTMTDAHLQLTDNYRVMTDQLDMESGTKTLTLDQTQFLQGFRLDISALDSSDVLT